MKCGVNSILFLKRLSRLHWWLRWTLTGDIMAFFFFFLKQISKWFDKDGGTIMYKSKWSKNSLGMQYLKRV